MTLSKLSEKLSIVAMLLIGFQYFALPLYTSRYDISSFLLVLSAAIATKKSKLISKTLIIVLTAFILIELVKYLNFQIAPVHRIFSGLVWIGGLILIFMKKDFIYYDQEKIFKAILIGTFITCTFMIIQNIGGMYRPMGLFDEPSYAGLFLYSISSAFFGAAILSNISFKYRLLNVVFGLIVMSFALLTLSMHIVTFSIVLSTTLFILLSINSSRALKLGVGIFMVLFLLILAYIIFDNPHYLVRISLVSNSKEISVLAWLRGLDQALHAFQMSPIFGLGLGSTGGFEIQSASQEMLEATNMGFLTKLDAYSMMFRLVVELGFALVLLFLFYIIVQLKNFREVLLCNISRDFDLYYFIFIFIFSFSLIVGILIKEPTYARSYVFVSIFLFTTILTIMKKDIAHKFNLS